jgi:3-oxoadipate enol-lactonase
MQVAPAQLGDFRVPTLIVVGTDDAFFSVEGLREVAGVIPGARFVVLEGAGHSAYFERPEQFNPIVQTWLEETGAWRSSS